MPRVHAMPTNPSAAPEGHPIQQQVHGRVPDMKCRTESKGKPYTLICTKTRGAWQCACERHARDMPSLRLVATLAESFSHEESASQEEHPSLVIPTLRHAAPTKIPA